MKISSKRSLIVSLVLLSFTSAFAVEKAEKSGVAQMMIASPTTTYAGKKVSENETLMTVGTLKTGSEGGAKLRLTGNDVVIELAANTEINLVLPPSGDPSESIELVRGRARIRVPKAKTAKDTNRGDSKPRFLLRHRKVTMGVRGTDFLAIANEELDETEVAVFEGSVEFLNENTHDSKMVEANHWSGVGGRFGEKVRPPMRLSPAGVGYFEKISHDTPNFSLQNAPAEKVPGTSQTTTPGH